MPTFEFTFYNTNDNTPTGTVVTTGPTISLGTSVGWGYVIGSTTGNLSDRSTWRFVLYLPDTGSGFANTGILLTGADMPDYDYLQNNDIPNNGTNLPVTDSGGDYIPDASHTYHIILVSGSSSTQNDALFFAAN